MTASVTGGRRGDVVFWMSLSSNIAASGDVVIVAAYSSSLVANLFGVDRLETGHAATANISQTWPQPGTISTTLYYRTSAGDLGSADFSIICS